MPAVALHKQIQDSVAARLAAVPEIAQQVKGGVVESMTEGDMTKAQFPCVYVTTGGKSGGEAETGEAFSTVEDEVVYPVGIAILDRFDVDMDPTRDDRYETWRERMALALRNQVIEDLNVWWIELEYGAVLDRTEPAYQFFRSPMVAHCRAVVDRPKPYVPGS